LATRFNLNIDAKMAAESNALNTLLYQQALLQRPEMKKMLALDKAMTEVLSKKDLPPEERIREYEKIFYHFRDLKNNILVNGTSLKPPIDASTSKKDYEYVPKKEYMEKDSLGSMTKQEPTSFDAIETSDMDMGFDLFRPQSTTPRLDASETIDTFQPTPRPLARSRQTSLTTPAVLESILQTSLDSGQLMRSNKNVYLRIPEDNNPEASGTRATSPEYLDVTENINDIASHFGSKPIFEVEPSTSYTSGTVTSTVKKPRKGRKGTSSDKVFTNIDKMRRSDRLIKKLDTARVNRTKRKYVTPSSSEDGDTL
jgi:hypothetical protein